MSPRVLRFSTADELAEAVAQLVLTRLLERQAQDEVHLCLSGGRIAKRTYEALAGRAETSALDSSKLNIWWGDENFLPVSDPQRNAGQSFGVLARTLSFNPTKTHPMPSPDGKADPHEAAFSYARELGDTEFDLCLLGVGEDGHVAGLFPHHPSSEPTNALVVGVTDSPKPPAERVSLTLKAINRSKAVWLIVSGEEKAQAVAAALGGDQDLPAALAKGTEETYWFLDQDAANLLPRYNCLL